MLAMLGESGNDLRVPAPCQFFQGAHIEVAVVKIGLEPRHVPDQETPVLMHRITAHGGGRRRNQFFQKPDHLFFGARLRQR
ncbi:hypothetical protein D3C83_27380 [compost metagenome]